MELDLFVARTHQMIDNVRGGRITSSTTEPFAACKTANDTAGGMDATVTVSSALVLKRIVITYAHACGGSSFSSSLAGRFWLTARLAILSVSSSASVTSSSSSCLRRRGPARPYPPSRRLSSGSIAESSSPALMAEAESEIKWFPRCVKAPSMLT